MLDNASWISYPNNMGFRCAIFKRCFKADKKIKKATLKISSLGCYYAEINGVRVGDFIFAPGWTSLKRVQMQEYDITNMLDNENEIKVSLSKGWFKGRINWHTNTFYRDMYESLIGEITIEYENGACDTIVTDNNWECSESKITFADFYDGEHYDANKEEKYIPCRVQNYDKSIIVKQQGEKIIEQETLYPLSIFKTPKGETVIDYGQNLTGYFEIAVDGNMGDMVDLSFAEVLDNDGNFYTENYRTAKAEFKYICKNGKQTYKPRHVFYGFRYIRVNSFPCELTSDSIKAIVVHSDIKRTGYLESSNPLLNRLFENIIWGQKGNFLDVPTDCPQRDERYGWTGDAQVFVKTATYNYNVEKFFKKWLTDLALDQESDGYVPRVIPHVLNKEWSRCGWGDASVICPWQIYLTYGSKDILKSQYKSMCLYLEYIKSVSTKKYLWTGGDHFGDWLGLDAPEGSYKGSSNEDFIASAFYYYSVGLVIKAGRAIGRGVTKYERLRESILKAIRKEFPTYKTQTECVLALHFDIAENKEAVSKQLADMIIANGNRLKTGFLGTPYLLHALSSNGYIEVAYNLLLQENYPSWLYSVKQGATTIWEHWDGINDKGEFWSKDMNSFNHYAYGSVADWVYGVACGIQPIEDKAGFKEVIIAPHPTDKLDYLSASIDTSRGVISSKWYHKDGKIRYEITTPVKATIIIDGKKQDVEKGSYIF